MQSPLILKFTSKAHRSTRYALSDAWGNFLARYPWEWFVTLTFVEDVHPEAALKKWRLWVSKINRELFGPRWAKKKHGGVYWVVSIEYQERGVIHLHALMTGLRETRRLTWMDKWQELDTKTGFARIFPVENNEAASRYVSKYISKGGEIFFSDNLKDISNDLLSSQDQAKTIRC